MRFAVIVAIAIALLGAVFVIQNGVPVTVVVILWRFSGSLATIVLVAAALGALVVALLCAPALLRRKWQIRRQSREIDRLKEAAAAHARAGRPERAAPLSPAALGNAALEADGAAQRRDVK